jgi:hypothetical protein
LVEWSTGIVTALAAVEPDPRAGVSDRRLDTAGLGLSPVGV